MLGQQVQGVSGAATSGYNGAGAERRVLLPAHLRRPATPVVAAIGVVAAAGLACTRIAWRQTWRICFPLPPRVRSTGVSCTGEATAVVA